MRLLAAGALLILLLPVVVFAQPCDALKCASQTKITGDTYCSNDDVYATYQEYFCSGNECVFKATERLVEECSFGCAVSSCITCDQKPCEAKSGFYDSKFCRDNNVYQPYREYFCDTEKGCTFSETTRLAESCDADTTCSGGRCGLCEPANCNANSNFYGDDFCNAGKVYREYRNYRCSGDKCNYSSQDVKLADCAYGCDDAKCALPRCEPGCESRSGFAGAPYCGGNGVYQAFRNYFCGVLNCEFNETQRKVSDCQSCSNGQCVVALATNEKVFEFNADFTQEKSEKNVTVLPKRVFNGVLFGSDGAEAAVNAFAKSVSFDVVSTNSLGILQVFADKNNVLNASAAWHYNVVLNANISRLSISATGSGFVFWMPAVYDLGTVSVSTIVQKQKMNEFSFQLNGELATLKSADIISRSAGVEITLNGQVIPGSAIPKSILASDNTIELASSAVKSAKAAIKIVY